MSKKNDLFNNTIILGIGRMSTLIISLILLPLYTKYLSPGEFGVIDLVVTYVALMVPVITMQLEMATFRFLIDARKDQVKVSKIISNVFYIDILVILFLLLMGLVFAIIVNIPYHWYIFSYGVLIIFYSQLLQVSRGLGHNKKYTIASIMNAIFTLLTAVLFVAIFEMGAKGVLLSLIISSAISTIYLIFSNNIYKYIKFDNINVRTKKELLRYSLPLVPNGLALWMINVASRTIILVMIGLYANGIYAISNKFTAIFLSIFGIFWMSWTEIVSLHINAKDKSQFISDGFNAAVSLFGALGLVMIAMTPYIFPILIAPDFNEAKKYIPITIVSALLGSVVAIYGAIYVAKKATGQLAFASIAAAIFSVIISIIFVPFYGIYAVAAASGIAFLIVLINRAIDVKKYVDVTYNVKRYSLIIIMYVFVFFSYYYNNPILNIIALACVLSFSIIINRQIMIRMMYKVSNIISSKNRVYER